MSEYAKLLDDFRSEEFEEAKTGVETSVSGSGFLAQAIRADAPEIAAISRLNVDLPTSLHKKFRFFCRTHSVSQRAAIEGMIRDALVALG